MKVLINYVAVFCISLVFSVYAVAEPGYTFDDLPGPFWEGGAEIELRVVDSDGQAVAGAEVDEATEYGWTYLQSGRPSQPERTPNTDAVGVYRFVLPDKFTHVVITHDTGVAIIGPEALIGQDRPMVVRLQPWATVTGKLVDAPGQPLASQAVKLEIGHWLANDLNTSLQVHYDTTTDEAGGFAFNRVPPGEVRVTHYERGTGGAGTPAFNRLGRTAVGHAKPGQELQLVVGGGGRTVRGRLCDEASNGQDPDKSASSVFIIPRVEPDSDWKSMSLPTPLDYSAWPVDKRRAWRAAFDRSAQRLAFDKKRAERRFIQSCFLQKVMTAPDGSFEFADMLEGEYRLEITRADNTTARFPFDLTRAEHEVDALDLGLLPIGSVRFGVGDHLPDFEMTELPVAAPSVTRRFSDFKGRYVLVDFWATWCGPCLREAPNVQEVVKIFTDDDRLAVVCISIDRTSDRPAHYVQSKSAGGVQAWLSPSQAEARNKAFLIPHVPSIWLIGPDGEIIAQDLFGEAIMAAVTDALAAAPGS